MKNRLVFSLLCGVAALPFAGSTEAKAQERGVFNPFAIRSSATSAGLTAAEPSTVAEPAGFAPVVVMQGMGPPFDPPGRPPWVPPVRSPMRPPPRPPFDPPGPPFDPPGPPFDPPGPPF